MHQALTGNPGAGVFLFSIQFCVKSDTFSFYNFQNVSIAGYTAKIPTFPYTWFEGQGRSRALPLGFSVD